MTSAASKAKRAHQRREDLDEYEFRAARLRRVVYRRAIPLVLVWFLLIGVGAGMFGHRLLFTVPVSALAAIIVSTWVAYSARRAIRRARAGGAG